MSKRVWYTRPWGWSPVPYGLYGSDDDNGCTYALGAPITGILVIKRSVALCFHWSRAFHEGHIELRQPSMEDVWIKSVEFDPRVSAYLGRDNDNLISVEVRTEDRPKWSYDKKINMGYLDLQPGPDQARADKTVVAHPQVMLDYDADGKLMGVEVFGHVF